MSRVLLSGVALATLFAGTGTAADLRAPYKAVPTAPVFSWAGLYIGTHTGVAAGSTTTQNVAPYGGFDAGVPLTYDLSPVGIFGGGEIGYNWQLGTVVCGAERDGGYLGARSRVVQNDDLVEVKYGAYGAFTGRAGLAFDRLLAYVKGGAAVARIKNTASDTDGGVIDPLDFSQVS